MKDYVDRLDAAEILGMTRHYMEKHKDRPGFPRAVRFGRKVWYRRDDIDAWGEHLARQKASGHSPETEPTGPTDEELAVAFGKPPPMDPHPEVTAMLRIASCLGTERAPKVRWPREIDEWPSGLYDTPYGVLIRRKT